MSYQLSVISFQRVMPMDYRHCENLSPFGGGLRGRTVFDGNKFACNDALLPPPPPEGDKCGAYTPEGDKTHIVNCQLSIINSKIVNLKS